MFVFICFYSNLLFRQQSAIHSLSNYQAILFLFVSIATYFSDNNLPFTALVIIKPCFFICFYSNLLFRQQSAIHSLSNHQAMFIFICFYSNLLFRQQSAIHSLSNYQTMFIFICFYSNLLFRQ
jgi:hypothetical protein